MSAKLTTIITRPSLDDLFWFEPVINWDLTIDDINAYVAYMGTGYMNTVISESITWDEIVARQSELRPDLVSTFLIHKDDAISLTTDIRRILRPGPQNQPPFNPFALTYTWTHEYDTLENLSASYLGVWALGGDRTAEEEIAYSKNLLVTHNNTAVERCFVDSSEVAFNGRW
jgi:hypothetical protein